MDFSSLTNFKLNIYYRGLKILTIKNILNNKIIFSNNDIIYISNNNIFLNKELICNDIITLDELIELYKYNLINRGYKFL